MDQHQAGADGISMGGSLLYVGLQVFNNFTRADWSFWLAMAVGVTTLLYNVLKIYKEAKRKN